MSRTAEEELERRGTRNRQGNVERVVAEFGFAKLCRSRSLQRSVGRLFSEDELQVKAHVFIAPPNLASSSSSSVVFVVILAIGRHSSPPQEVNL